MADLVKTLEAVLGHGTMNIVTALVTAVDTEPGQITVGIWGADVAVPYIPMGGWQPQVGDLSYVVLRRDWGGVAIGKPAHRPAREVPS